MVKKDTVPQAEIDKYYDPNYFYEHGDNPALKKFMEIQVENNREGKILDTRTYTVDRTTKWFLARNWEDVLQRDLKCFNFVRAGAIWAPATLAWGVGIGWAVQMMPVGQHGYTSMKQTQFYHQFGPIGALGLIAFTGLSTYLWWRTTVFTGKKFYNHVILGERAWLYEQERQNPGFGEYFFSDSPLSHEEAFPDNARGEAAKKKWEVPEWHKN